MTPVIPTRRALNDAQWLEAMGIDPFWITEASSGVAATSTAAAAVKAPEVLPGECPAEDWPRLDAEIRACRACDLCQGRKQAVPGAGDRKASWLLVGEAPGADEDNAGLPFVGKAGQLLDAMLAALNLDRQAGVYITNAVKCRPPQNRTPDRAEMDACNRFLAQQIAWIQPSVIVALGKPAAYAVLGQDAAIQSLRGTVHFLEQGRRRIPVIVTYHPAYLLRQPEEKRKSWQDLLQATSVLAGQ